MKVTTFFLISGERLFFFWHVESCCSSHPFQPLRSDKSWSGISVEFWRVFSVTRWVRCREWRPGLFNGEKEYSVEGLKINRTARTSILTGTQHQPNHTTLSGTAKVKVQQEKKTQPNTGTSLHKFLLEFSKREGVFLCRVAWIVLSVYLCVYLLFFSFFLFLLPLPLSLNCCCAICATHRNNFRLGGVELWYTL